MNNLNPPRFNFNVDSTSEFNRVIRREYKNYLTAEEGFTYFLHDRDRELSEKAVKEGTTKLKLDDVRYYINDIGARGDWSLPLPEDSIKIAFFGCSFTVGVGIDENKIFPNLVKKHFEGLGKKVSVINLGSEGGDVSRTLRFFKLLTDVQKIDYAVLLLPTHWRHEHPYSLDFTDTVNYYNIIPNIDPKLFTTDDNLAYQWDNFFKYSTNTTRLYDSLKNVHHINQIAQNKQIDLLMSSWDRVLYESIEQDSQLKNKLLPYFVWANNSEDSSVREKARDGEHPGETSHLLFANDIINHLSNFIF
jgi:hypothetical protein